MEENKDSNLTYGEQVSSSVAQKVGMFALYALLGIMGIIILLLPFSKLWSYEFCCFIETFFGWAYPCLFGIFAACSAFCAQTCEKSIKREK